MFTTYYQLAYDAIEAVVAEEKPRWSYRWQAIKPTGDEWGYAVDAWEAPATRIVANFNGRLPEGQLIDVPRTAKRKSASELLVGFQAYLATKAEAQRGAAFIEQLELEQ